MPELRKDPVLGRWIIIAQERGKRPTDFVIDKTPTTGGFCPLCPGNENTTPHEVLVYGREGEDSLIHPAGRFGLFLINIRH